MYEPDLTISPSEEPVEEFELISLEDAKNGKGKYMYARKKVLRKYTMPAVWFLAYINNFKQEINAMKYCMSEHKGKT